MSSFLPPRASGSAVLPLVTAAVWALAAAGIAYWVLHWPKAELAVAAPEPTSSNYAKADQHVPMSRALGQSATQAASLALQTSSEYKLIGVIASVSGQGSALIATDGQPAKAYKVGQTVQDGWTIVSLTARQARLKSSSAEILLELPFAGKP
jgi:general secretion pathway protein C